MPIRPDLLLAHGFADIRQAYSDRDTILYALGVGLGADDLAFVLEDRLEALPTFAVTLGSPGPWIKQPDFSVDFARLVHYEQAAMFHRPLPPAGEIVASARVAAVHDRGAGKGALVILERAIRDAGSNALYCELKQTLLLRGDGGFGGSPAPYRASLIPDRAHDVVAAYPIDPRAALIYRLSGDWNPLHADPQAAARGGFERPILHGLASYGAAAIAVARALERSPAEVKQLDCRFAGVVYPGDTLSFRIWRSHERAVFRAFVGERKTLDQGLIAFREKA